MNGDGVIDFQEFISACLDRKALVHKEDLVKAFQIIDHDKDGQVSREDFQQLFRGKTGAQLDESMWDQLLKEADKNGDGTIGYEEFSQAMTDMFRKSWLRPCDRSPSKSPTKSASPCKSCRSHGDRVSKFNGDMEESSPLKVG